MDTTQAHELVLVGLSHKTAPVDVRQKSAIPKAKLRDRLTQMCAETTSAEMLIVSTCNRTEILAAGPDGREVERRIRDAFPNEARPSLYSHHGPEAVIHLFSVCSGLRSMVLGESEIQAQIKDAWTEAQAAGTVGTSLEALLQQAMRVGKRIRTETALTRGTLSVASAAVELSTKVFSDLKQCRALVIGAGETGLLVATHLRERGIKDLTFTNRTLERAQLAAEQFSASVIPFDQMIAAVADHDVVVACVEAPMVLFGAKELESQKWPSRDVPKVFVDLSIPRALDKNVNGFRDAFLFDLDALQAIVDKHLEARRAEVEQADRIILEEVHKFLALRIYAALSPAVAGLAEQFEAMRQKWLESHKGVDPAVLDALSKDLSKHLLAVAQSQIKAGTKLTQSELAIERSYRRYREQHMIGLATRGSPLALWQAEHARAALASAMPGERIEFVTVSTSGDDVQDRPVVLMGATGVFTVEVDRAVVDGRARCGVHSLKDLATQLEGGMVLAAVLPRGPVEDVIVSPRFGTLSALPDGARVATGSLRRRAMLLRKRPDLVCVDIRGFVGTRLKKLERGDADALLMARAGLERLGMKDRITEVLPIDAFLPAVGQGLVGITCRADDREMVEAWRRAGDADGFAAGTAERAFLATLRAGCHAPVGGHAVMRAGRLHLEGRVLSKDGVREVAGSASSSSADAATLGADLARRLMADGASELLEG